MAHLQVLSSIQLFFCGNWSGNETQFEKEGHGLPWEEFWSEGECFGWQVEALYWKREVNIVVI